MIIGLVGFIGSGKGTVGDILETQGFSKDSFAKPLKDACSIMFGWPREMLEGDTEVSRKWREEPEWYKLAEDAAAGFSSAIMGMKDKGIHQSEWDWIGSEFNYTIDNDGTVNELGNKVKELLQFIR